MATQYNLRKNPDGLVGARISVLQDKGCWTQGIVLAFISLSLFSSFLLLHRS